MTSNKEKLDRLTRRAFENLVLRTDYFSCTLAFILQEKLENPKKAIRVSLLKSFEDEEPLMWTKVKIPEIGVMVLNEKDMEQLVFVDTFTGEQLLVLPKCNMKITSSLEIE